MNTNCNYGGAEVRPANGHPSMSSSNGNVGSSSAKTPFADKTNRVQQSDERARLVYVNALGKNILREALISNDKSFHS
jgi:hypothetical protein